MDYGGEQLYLGRGEHRTVTALACATQRSVSPTYANVDLGGFLESAGVPHLARSCTQRIPSSNQHQVQSAQFIWIRCFQFRPPSWIYRVYMISQYRSGFSPGSSHSRCECPVMDRGPAPHPVTAGKASSIPSNT